MSYWDPSVERNRVCRIKLNARHLILCLCIILKNYQPLYCTSSEKLILPLKQNQATFSSSAIYFCHDTPESPLVSVSVRLVGPIAVHTNVVCLFLCQCRQLCSQSRQMEPGHFLIQLLGEKVHVILVLLCLLPVLETLKLSHLNLIVEVANVSDNRVVLHSLHVLEPDD